MGVILWNLLIGQPAKMRQPIRSRDANHSRRRRRDFLYLLVAVAVAAVAVAVAATVSVARRRRPFAAALVPARGGGESGGVCLRAAPSILHTRVRLTQGSTREANTCFSLEVNGFKTDE